MPSLAARRPFATSRIVPAAGDKPRRPAGSQPHLYPHAAAAGTSSIPGMSVPDAASALRVGFLGPEGTFTEQALVSQADLAGHRLVGLPSIPDVLSAAEGGDVDLGFVGIENSIEGAVT